MRIHATRRFDWLVSASHESGNGFEWINGPIVNAIASGYTFVADEMNLCSPNVIKRFATVYESNYIDLMEGDGTESKAKKALVLLEHKIRPKGLKVVSRPV